VKSLRFGAQALSVALVVGLLALLGWKVAHQVGHDTVASQLSKGSQPSAPAFALTRLDGRGGLSSASFAGKPQVLNFWASWCGPCRAEAPLFVRAAQQYDRRVLFLGVDHQDFAGDARAFARRHGFNYPSVVDKGDKLYAAYGLTGVPETFCVDAHGRVVAHVPGAVTRDSLDQCIQDALSS
jgi:cytochrome c biogenesis protein CcmG/thiol:disulfide interchange protein DsbE